MCVACNEYIKNKLTSTEFKSALREASMDDPAHKQQVENLMDKYSENPEELKKLLTPLETNKKDY